MSICCARLGYDRLDVLPITMDAERLQQIQDLYHAVRDCAPESRDSVLDEACQNDKDLRGEVASLLAQNGGDTELLSRRAISLLGRVFSAPLGPGDTVGPFQIESL